MLTIGGTRVAFSPRSAAERMSHWHELSPTAARNVYYGIDSVAEWNGSSGVQSYAGLMRDTMTIAWGSRGYGWIGCHRNIAIPNTNEWTVGANWTSFTTRDANDDGPFTTDGRQHTGTTSTTAANLLTLSEIPATTTRFEIVWQDMAGTSGPWAYRIDAGAWVNNPATRVGDNTMKRLLVSSPITTSLDIRPCNAAGTTATLCGIDGVSLLNDATEGHLTHLFAMSGQSTAQLTRGTLGNNLGFFTTMDTPDLAVLGSGNDCTTTVTTGKEGYVDLWANNFIRLLDAFPASTSLVLMTTPPLDHVAYPQRSLAMQTEWAAMTVRIGKAVGAPVIDIFNEWGGNYAAAEALGFQSIGDGAHSTQAGQTDMHDRLAAVLGL